MQNLKWPEPFNYRNDPDLDRMIDADIEFDEHEKELLKEIAEALDDAS